MNFPNYIMMQEQSPPMGDFFSDMKEKILKEVETRARQGAEQAIPQIKTEVENTVKPYIYAAIGAAGLALLVGIAGYVRAGN